MTTKPIIKHLSNETSNIEEASVIPCITELTCEPPSEYELPIPYHTSPSDAGGNVSLILNIHTHKKIIFNFYDEGNLYVNVTFHLSKMYLVIYDPSLFHH